MARGQISYHPDDPEAPEPLIECARCEREIGEDEQLTLDGDVLCHGCALERLTEDAAAMLDPYHTPTAGTVDRLDAGMVTFKALVREVERRVDAAKRKG